MTVLLLIGILSEFSKHILRLCMCGVLCDPATNANDYFVAGVVMALSMIHEGPAPSFLATELFQGLVGIPEHVHVSIDALPDCTTKDGLKQVSFVLLFSSKLCTFLWSISFGLVDNLNIPA